jgi:acyl-CoA thioester hydrolase
MHKTVLKVRTYECDSYGHVNNAVYLNYLEYARMEWLHSVGYTLKTLREEKKCLVVVVRIDIQFRKPAFEGDELEIITSVKEMRNTSGTFLQKIIRSGTEELISVAEVTWVFTDLTGKPIPIPAEIREKFEKDI